MGSDMYMEAQNWRSRPNKIYWDGEDLVIEKDAPISGYHEVWRRTAPVMNQDMQTLLLTMVPTIPAKPVSIDNQLKGVLNSFYDSRMTVSKAVERIKEIFNADL